MKCNKIICDFILLQMHLKKRIYQIIWKLTREYIFLEGVNVNFYYISVAQSQLLLRK